MVSGLSPAQLQAATQRLIVTAGAGGQAKAVVGNAGVSSKQLSQAQLQMIRQASLKSQLRLANNLTQVHGKFNIPRFSPNMVVSYRGQKHRL